MDPTEATMLAWVIMTPFGSPVEPEVYMIHARSDGDGLRSCTSNVDCFPRSKSSSRCMNLTLRGSGGDDEEERRGFPS